MKKAEFMFLPVPGMGHLVSTVQVDKLLLDLNSNPSITILITKTPYDSATVTTYLESITANTNSTRCLKFITLPEDETLKDIPPTMIIHFIAPTLRPHIKAAVSDIVHHSATVPDSPQLTGIILDMLLAPLVDVAKEFGVPSYVFYTSGAAFLSFQFFMQILHDEQNVDHIAEFKNSDAEFALPSYINPVSAKLFPEFIFHYETVDMINCYVRVIREVNGIMLNTFLELEPYALASLSDDEIPPVYPVGPILNLTITSEADHDDGIIKWLDEQPPSSVVFLCFGSMESFGEDQVKEIACALEQSGLRFLWSLR